MGLFSRNKQPKPKTVAVKPEPVLKVTSADIVAKELAMAYIRGKLQAKNHPKWADLKYLERSIGTIWKAFLPNARALITKL